jgi:hypothetical protein
LLCHAQLLINTNELFRHVSVFLSKPVNTTGRIDKTLLTREKGMAMGTNFDIKLCTDSGLGAELVSAGASHCGFINFGMQIFLHGKPPVSKRERTTKPLGDEWQAEIRANCARKKENQERPLA